MGEVAYLSNKRSKKRHGIKHAFDDYGGLYTGLTLSDIFSQSLSV